MTNLYLACFCSGCLTQYVGALDRPWASFALALEQLQHMVRSKEGIETVLRQLDWHLSEAIMQAIENGPHLAGRVSNWLVVVVPQGGRGADGEDASPS